MLEKYRLAHFGLEIGGHGGAQREDCDGLKSADDKFPDDIKRFVGERIPSVEVLEILLLVFADPQEEWSALEVSRKLCTSVNSARSRLQELEAAKVLLSINTEPVKYRFHRENAPMFSLVGELERIYKERRVSVISLIYSKPAEPLRAFSDAFRLRKDEE